jgi:hypothetical protein
MFGAITPAQVAEMAKAGVTIDFKDVVGHLDCSAARPELMYSDGSHQHLTRLLEERLLRPSLAAGLRYLRDGDEMPFMASTRVSDDVIVTFLVANGQPLMLEDDARMFPSDALITKIRLLETK